MTAPAAGRVRLFVYGTLRAGGARHDLLGDAIPLGVATTSDGWSLVDLGAYPGLVEAASGRVLGELYAIAQARIAPLDDYEGHPRLFERRAVALGDGSEALAYVYLGPERAPTVAHGDWQRRGSDVLP